MRPGSPAKRTLLAALLLLSCARRERDQPRADPAPGASTTAASAPSTPDAPTALAASPGQHAEPPADHEPAPPTLPIVSAEELIARVRSSGKKGALVNAWASFCGPCRREIPMLQNLAPNLRASGIDVVLVSVDDPADVEKAIAFLQNNHITLPSLAAKHPLGPFKQGMNPRWPGMLPASFLFDANGRLRYFWGGEAFEEELLPVLDAFAAGRPIEGESNFLVAPEAPTP